MKVSRYLVAGAAVLAMVATLAGCGSTTRSVAPSPPLDTTPPSIPDGLTQVFDPYTSIVTLSWSPSPSPDVAHFDVYLYSPDPSRDEAYVKVGQTSASDPSWSLPTSSTETTYHLRVRAVDGAGNASAFSPVYSATVPAFQPPGAGGGTDDRHRRRTDS